MMWKRAPERARQGVHLADNETKTRSDSFFLPDFCGLHAVFGVVVLSELFAFVLTLAKTEYGIDFWSSLALTSLFMQWAGLTGAAVLCLGRRRLAQLGDRNAALVSYALLLLVIFLLSEVAYWYILDLGLRRGLDGHNAFVLHNMGIGAIVSALALRYFFINHTRPQKTLSRRY